MSDLPPLHRAWVWNGPGTPLDLRLADLAAGTLEGEPVIEAPFEDLAQCLDALRHRDFSGKPIILL